MSCLSCRAPATFDESAPVEQFTSKNGRAMVRGQCSVCKKKVTAFVKVEKKEEVVVAEEKKEEVEAVAEKPKESSEGPTAKEE